MTLSERLVSEFDQEMISTRKLIERTPTDKGPWKPHPRSFALGHLSQLVATMPGWITRTLREDTMDIAGGAGYSFQNTESLVEQFDRHVREAHDALVDTTDAAFDLPWTLKMGDQVLITQPRYEAVRSHINHLSHHRGQLSVYLRLLDVPVPSIYGPTADEPWGSGG
jgi:uncharacterized damage-inducible protein DinB